MCVFVSKRLHLIANDVPKKGLFGWNPMFAKLNILDRITGFIRDHAKRALISDLSVNSFIMFVCEKKKLIYALDREFWNEEIS